MQEKDNIIVLNDRIKRLIDKDTRNQTRRLTLQLTSIINRTNDILELIKNDDEYISNHEPTVKMMLKRINVVLDNSKQITNEEIDNEALEKIEDLERVLESHYRNLSSKFYSNSFNELARKHSLLNEKLNKSQQQLEVLTKEQANFNNQKKEFEESVKKTNSKLESLGATFINIVLTISITSSLISVLDKAKNIIESFTIVLGCAWLLLSSILFVSEYFKNDTTQNKRQMTIYWTLTAVFFILFAISCIVRFKKM